MKELFDIVRARRAQPAIPFALATVVYVDGSSYRKPGARMLAGLNGRVAGSVSGGCLERDVLTRARAIILGAPAELAVYDTSDQDDMAFGTSLGCEGRVEILIHALAPGAEWPLAETVERVLRDRVPVILATPYRTQAREEKRRGESRPPEELPGTWRTELAPAVEAATSGKKPVHAHLASGSMDFLIERIAPPTRLVIFGGGHDVPPLVRLARELGYQVTVVDRRADFAEPERFPGADAVRHLRPREVLAAGLLDPGTAAVVMNHHYETDAELLALLVGQPLAYLGMLGPRQRTLKILREALSAGAAFSAGDLERLHAPVGLDLGSESPEQIALCILAEVQTVVNGRTGIHLRQRSYLAAELFEPAALDRA